LRDEGRGTRDEGRGMRLVDDTLLAHLIVPYRRPASRVPRPASPIRRPDTPFVARAKGHLTNQAKPTIFRRSQFQYE
jgi:hypothetical protein